MRYIRAALLSSIASLFLSACTGGSLIDVGSKKSLLVGAKINTYDYNSTHTLVKLTAHIGDNTKIVPLHEIHFYSSPKCESPALGQGLAQDLSSTGIDFNVPIGNNLKVYFKLNTDNNCHYLIDYTLDIELKPTASFVKTSPNSPSRSSFEPAIFGTLFPSSGRVEIYSNADCTIPLANAQQEQFEKTGVQVTLQPESSNLIYIKAKDLLGQESPCSHLTTYTHSTAVAAKAQFHSAHPASPQNSTTTPSIRGSLEAGITHVKLYSNAACTTEVGSGTAADFTGSGISADIAENAITHIYAQTRDNHELDSNCIFLTSYIHDSIPPVAPTFVSASPASPTRLTTFPKIKGTAPADSQVIRFYDSSTCQSHKVIGWNTRAQFTGDGINANLPANKTTAIYATSIDAAGNASECILLTNYRHNTIPPAPPIFSNTDPLSPTNLSNNPRIIGFASENTKSLHFYRDEDCQINVGSGSAENYEDAGIPINALFNDTTNLYAAAEDEEGNVSECNFLTSYSHSNEPATNASFSMAFPASPTRVSPNPVIIGFADTSIVSVSIFSDNSCTQSLGTGTRSAFVTAGVQISVPLNATTDLYARTTNIYGNVSTCSLLTTYTHTTLPPLAPTLVSITPLSPNNVTSQPTVVGNSFQNPASPLAPTRVVFYDSPGCVANVGEGTPETLSTTGLQITLPENAASTVYARSFDAAFNASECVFITNYTYNNLSPSRPVHGTATPNTPSYTNRTLLRGTYAYSPDFMDKVSIEFFSDSSCTQLMTSGSPTEYSVGGIQLEAPLNTTTPIYARTYNEVGNRSDCSFLINYRHSDVGPSAVTLTQNLNGSLQLNWSPDMIASPLPTYTVKRALQSDGPYTLVASGLNAATYTDNNINHGQAYFYRVQSSNITGSSKDSDEVSLTVNSPPPTEALSLTASPGPAEARLSWTGFMQNMMYRVERAQQSGGPYTRLPVVLTTTNYTDSTVSNSNIYYYRIIAINPFGESTASNEAQVVPLPPAPKVASIWLSPRRSSPDCAGNSGLHVYWAPAQYSEGYELWRQATTTVLLTQTMQNEFVDCSPHSGALSRYRVASKWGSLASVQSDEARFYDAGALNLFIYPGDNHIFLNWGSVGASDNYDIYRSTNRNGPFAALQIGYNSTTYIDSSVSNGDAYYYYVQARQGTSYSGWPSLIAGAKAAALPNEPQNLTISTHNSGSPQLHWVAPSHYNRFLVYRASNAGGPYGFLSYSNSAEYLDNSASNGMNYYRITAQWGNSQTTYSNIASFRKSTISGLTATRNADNITLNWNNLADISDYRVERSLSINGNYTTIAFPVSNTYEDTTALAGVGYYYRVRSRFADSTEGQVSNPVGASLTGNSVPTGLSVLSASASNISIGWLSVTGATQYKVYRATELAGPYSLINTVGSGAISYNFIGLTARSQYYFKIAAVISGVDHLSDAIAQATLAKPTPPLGDIGNNQISLSWSPATGVTNYNLERSSDRENFITVANGIVSTTYTDTGLTNGQQYFYRLIANYDLGSVTSDVGAGLTPGISPLAPAGLHIDDNSVGTAISLSWAPVTGATGYYIYQSNTSGGPYGAPILLTSTTSGVNIPGLDPATVYYFVVTARSGHLESPFSNQVSAITSPTPPAPVATYQSASSIQITWSVVAGASHYQLERSTDGFGYFTIAPNVATTTYTDSSFSENKSYRYRVRPISAAGHDLSVSAASNAVFTTTEPLPPSTVKLWATNINTVQISWSKVPNVVSYRVYRSTTSGSGYSLVQTVTDPTVSWTNTGLTSGQSYYYIIRSVNASGVPSADSPEKGISLTAAPTGLAAVNNNGKIDLSWNNVAGATNYHVYRSDKSGGPYGWILSSNLLNAEDLYTTPYATYYYVVEAEFASGLRSIASSEVTATKAGSLSFQIPVEMIDRGIASSNTTSQVFNRSLTRINSNDYDGSVSYSVELTASNADNIARTISLVDGANTVLANITVPANTFDPTRYEITVALAAGEHDYKLRLQQTDSNESLIVYSARILITQSNATKTRIYFPLIASSLNPTSEDETALVINTASNSYSRLADAMPYVRRVQALSKLKDFNAWRMDALVLAESGVQGKLRLQNVTSDSLVGTQEAEITNTNLRLIQMPIQEGVAQFGTFQEGHHFEPQLRCTIGCANGQVKLFKAGLWVNLENLTQLEIPYRTSLGVDLVGSDTDFEQNRIRIDLSKFTSPQIYFQANASLLSGQADIMLSSSGVNESGNSGLSDINSSRITFYSSPYKQTQTTYTPISLSSNDRLLTSLRTSGAMTKIHGTQLLIRIAP